MVKFIDNVDRPLYTSSPSNGTNWAYDHQTFPPTIEQAEKSLKQAKEAAKVKAKRDKAAAKEAARSKDDLLRRDALDFARDSGDVLAEAKAIYEWLKEVA